jgi:type II secretory pathway component PulF
MSLDDEDDLLPPRQELPRPRSKPRAERTTEPESTFQPAPARPGARKPKGDREPIPVRGAPSLLERVVYGKVSSGHLAIFCRQFASYQEAGVDLLKTLTSLQRQFAQSALGPVIGRMDIAIRKGDAIAEAMSREPQAFDRLTLSMIRVAEARGGIPETLRRLSEYYEARQRMIRQARSALIYPTIVLIVASGVVFLLTLFVIPGMIAFIKDSPGGRNLVLPWPTQVLLSVSGFMTSVGWWLVPVVAVGSVILLPRFYKTATGRNVLDSISLYLPVLGKIRKKIETSRFARNLGVLLQAGVDVGLSLKLTSDVMALAPYRRAVLNMNTLVNEGSDLSEAIQATHRFTSDVVAIVNSGEESGKLPESLEKLADDYEEQVEYMIKNLGNLIQPILMIGLGGIVCFIILGVILAYIQMITSASGA